LFRGLWRIVGSTAAVVLLAGCSGKGEGGGTAAKVVASAGDITVTLADFQQAYDQITENYRPDIGTLEGKRSFANDLLNRAILLDEGYKLGGIGDPKIQGHLERARDNQMLQLLYRNEVEAKVDVLGRDVAELYEKRKFNVRASHILLDDVEEAKRVREEIVSGKISFEDAARKYSIDQSSRGAGGALSEIMWGRNLPQFQAMAFELEPGNVSEPVETTIGVHLIRVDERLPQELPDLESMRPQLRTDARRQLEAVRLNEFVEALEEKLGLAWNETTLDRLMERIEEETHQDIDTIPPAEQYIPDVTAEEREMEIASWKGGRWTIGDYVDYLGTQPPNARPVSRLPRNGLREYIRTAQIREKLLVIEARERGYDLDPEVVKADARLREQILVNMVHGRFLQAADVPEEDARALYDSTRAENPDALMLPERVDMMVLVHSDADVVREGLRRIKAGEPENEVIGELSIDFRTRTQGGRTGLVARGNYAPQLEEVAFGGRAGKGWSQVVETESGSGAVKVLAHEQPRIAEFDEMRDQIVQSLANQRGEAAFEEWLQARRDELGVEIHDDVLALIGQSVS